MSGKNDHDYDEDNIAMLISMGFPRDQSIAAWKTSDGNMDAAINLLLEGGPAETTTNSTLTNDYSFRLVVAPISQYNAGDSTGVEGRSACTVISLVTAASFLQLDAKDKVSCEFLQANVLEGIEMYRSITMTNGSQSSSSEHMSTEEALQVLHPFVDGLVLAATHQGVLSSDLQSPMGLFSMLRAVVVEDARSSSEWMCIALTKPPETVLVCIPPPRSSPSATTSHSFILFDSHSRPGIDGAYAKMHNSLEALVQSVQEIFPPTNLGDDVPEIMAMMYNSFDLCVLRKSPDSSR